ncbi:hypothetical protein ABIB75_002758 [Bradyrhizobium sp. GM2.2]|jgi:hypothetical protein|nr:MULTISPECIES: hypothetical protein [unclassified Bradyrhizobium]UPJ75682.1 hypothetical protein IVB19_14710 [Bradyrhizobium sp. 187]UPK09098.1 hypothetical protein IVA93_22215 [Bradyrhizobium sp. 155]UPK22147.1 hypothetical protein IVA73_15120 [Bradyrhizobium sp. 131]MCK1273111.1 hypothetical protein [Bradyrhizobium sp. 84]MCK1293677.1 hypothetical protein [Bradyrhizobium sp. 30]
MPTELIRASARATTPNSNVRNASIVAIALTAALVALELVGLAMLERSHAYAQPSVPLVPTVCTESTDVPVSQIPYD